MYTHKFMLQPIGTRKNMMFQIDNMDMRKRKKPTVQI